jgi:hypothetical protein
MNLDYFEYCTVQSLSPTDERMKRVCEKNGRSLVVVLTISPNSPRSNGFMAEFLRNVRVLSIRFLFCTVLHYYLAFKIEACYFSQNRRNVSARFLGNVKRVICLQDSDARETISPRLFNHHFGVIVFILIITIGQSTV